MKQKILFLILFLNFFGFSILGLNQWERANIFSRVTKPLNAQTVEIFNSVRELYLKGNDTIKYDVSKIKSIIKNNNFPENYNFFDSTKVPKVIRNQGSCGSCWSLASTTVLSYRYKKNGVDLDLSSQFPVSCFIPDCHAGATAVQAIFNLVKNGTVKDQCLPFSSSDGKNIEKCPSKCKDNSDFKKYYGKNAYTTFDDYSEENYYDIVTLIMDQLTNYGPVITSINVYKDFYLTSSVKNCANYIYSHKKEEKEDYSGHAMVIVGYGYEQSKYYWLIQNSWGDQYCDNGLIKIEFGQIGIERVAFLDPDIEKSTTEITNIPLTFNIDKECNLEFTADSYDNFNDGFEITAQNKDAGDSLYFQCGRTSSKGEKINKCFISRKIDTFYNKSRGSYQITEAQSFGNSNKYQVKNSPYTFDYYGADLIIPFFSDTYIYVSEAESKIVLNYANNYGQFKSKIYPNKNSNNNLKDCRLISLGENSPNIEQILACHIKSDELKYFENTGTGEQYYLYYDVLCGDREYIPTIVKKLDKSKYPIFKITKMILRKSKTINISQNFKLKANIEGSLSNFNNEKNNSFVTYAEVKYNGKTKNYFAICFLNNPTKIKTNHDILCTFVGNENINYDSITLSPYSYPRKNGDPFEIFISNSIKGEDIPEEFINESGNQNIGRYRSKSIFIKISFSLIISLLILL